jgi:hypothetical protein
MSAGTLPIRESAFLAFFRRSCVRTTSAIVAATLLWLLCVSYASAQDHWPAGSIAKLEGDDISVEGGAFPVSVAGATTLFVTSGGVVTVHVGLARLTLSTGSTADIAGPAKFTVLESGGAFTLALNFGRVRLHLADSTPIRVYAPFVVATPIAIANEERDFTIGLDPNDLMCVYAAKGAARLEPQFGGDAVFVPQSGELMMPGERLPPIAAKEGSCRCAAYQPPVASRPRQTGAPDESSATTTTNSQPASSTASPAPAKNAETNSAAAATPKLQPATPPAAPPPAPASDADKGFELPANANTAPPITPPANDSAPEPPAVTQPIVKVIMPPLSFTASSPSPPRDNSPQYALIIPADARVSRDWIFSGHVEEASARGKQSGGGDSSGSSNALQKKKHGFWSRMRQFFGGEQPRPAAKPDAGAFQN